MIKIKSPPPLLTYYIRHITKFILFYYFVRIYLDFYSALFYLILNNLYFTLDNYTLSLIIQEYATFRQLGYVTKLLILSLCIIYKKKLL
jgi:hypothetical protein